MLIGTFGGHHLGGGSCPTTFEVGSLLDIIAMGCFYAADILSLWVAFVRPFHAQTCDPKPFGIQSYVLALRCCILREGIGFGHAVRQVIRLCSSQAIPATRPTCSGMNLVCRRLKSETTVANHGSGF